jgi:hypothetical protein
MEEREGGGAEGGREEAPDERVRVCHLIVDVLAGLLATLCERRSGCHFPCL